tara:strand:+ start:240967 stop:241926 length:960 start_codon:yes stop_codon:yes gene_type:complete
MKKSTHFIFAITFAFSFLIPIMAVAQPASTGSPEKLISNSSKEYQRPAWSPDGSKIAFTAGRNQGIWITNADGTDMKQVTDEIAGFGFSWSMDSQNILARVSETENRRQKMGIKIYGLDGSSTQITELRDDMPALPTWANFDENVVLITNDKIEKFDSGKETPEQFKTKSRQAFYVLKPNSIATGMVPENTTTDISPFEDAKYLNLEVSPDGQKLAFEVYGGNLYVMNIDGSGLVDLGKANRPSWSPDSKYVCAMVAEDDGHSYKSSDLIAFSADGSQQINLTQTTDLIAMNPAWSPSGDKIAFDSPDDGSIYILNISQ